MIGQQIINGVSMGMVYALIAVGYSLVFGILRLLNMSHGAVYAFGAYIAYIFIGKGLGMGYAVVLSIIVTGILGLSIDRVVLRPLRQRKAENITCLISVFGVSYIIQNTMLAIFSSRRQPFPKLFTFDNVNILGFTFTSMQIVIILASILLLAILSVLIYCTKIGFSMRAVQQNEKAANLMGINVKQVITFTFFLGGVTAAVAGVLVGGYYEMVYPTMGVDAGLKAFSAAVLGGVGSLYGAVFGGIVVGIAEALAVTFLGSSFRDATAFIILFIVLLIKPSGLFGKEDITKV